MDSRVLEPRELSEVQLEAMFGLMQAHYDGTDPAVFRQDLARKDYVILLEQAERLVGFSTQQLLEIEGVRGVFSGDTIVHRDHWGSPRLSQQFARFFLPFGQDEPFYWFLISKGYKTYKFLPTFFVDFHPRQGVETPPEAQALIDSFGARFFPGEYDPESGVVRYQGPKDRLKPELQDLPERPEDPDWRFFLQRNPGFRAGHDLVCLARLHPENLKPRARRLLLGAHAGEAGQTGPTPPR